MKIVGLRNNICVKNGKMTCGSKMLENFISPYNSTIVERLNTAGVKTENIDMKEFGVVEDNFIQEFFAGNTSNTAIMVDGSGEIARNSVNGLIGIKPTFGAVSRYGVVTVAPSLEQAGVISKDINELKEVFDIIKGYDEKDSASVKEVLENKQSDDIKIGAISEAMNLVNGFTAQKVEITNLKYAKKVACMISSAESSSNLARYDGIKYGHRAENTSTWKEVYTKSRQEGFGYDVKKKMIAGTFFLDRDNMEEYYKRAEKIRTLIKQEVKELFKKVDVIAIPSDSEYTCIANLTGRPAISANGVTLIGNFFEEERLIKLASELTK
ncbi:MAG: amidase family protein [Oscillospiraceae bacterium]|nr:amidase family protein [Oscillospiraceae bacterium]